MAYTFGGGTGDDITYTIGNTPGATGSSFLCSGWWLPTTLSAGLGLWSAGNVVGAEIDSTTDELRLKTDNATTDGEWTTTGVDLAAGTWKFLSFFLSCLNGTPSAVWKVWAGDLSTPPTACTVTNAVSPVGNFTGSASLYVGNKGTGTVAFQGDIDQLRWVISAASASATLHPFGIAAYGALSAAEEQFVYERFVLPHWLGNGFEYKQIGAAASAGIDDLLWDGNFGTRVVRVAVSAAQLSSLTPTVNGATVSANRCPRPALINGGPFSAARRR